MQPPLLCKKSPWHILLQCNRQSQSNGCSFWSCFMSKCLLSCFQMRKVKDVRAKCSGCVLQIMLLIFNTHPNLTSGLAAAARVPWSQRFQHHEGLKPLGAQRTGVKPLPCRIQGRIVAYILFPFFFLGLNMTSEICWEPSFQIIFPTRQSFLSLNCSSGQKQDTTDYIHYLKRDSLKKNSKNFLSSGNIFFTE